MTAHEDRARLLRLARDAIVAHVSGLPAPRPELQSVLGRRGGCFVTLYTGEALRGCIGHLGDDQPLGRVIPRCAVSAATQDPRFPTLDRTELPALQIEVSLLAALEPIAGPADIEI